MTSIFEAGIQPDRENANEGTQRGRGLLEKSLRQLGAGRSILTDKDGNVIAGNKTLETAADIDLPVRIIETDGNELVVVKRTDLDLYSETDKRARQLAYADNKVSEVDLAWKPEQIAVDFEPLELKDWGFDDPNPPVADAEPQIDRAAELNEKWQVKAGDLWQIGEHRLLCGDSTVKADVERVMQGELARLVWTDPPYGVNYGEKLESANPMGYRVRTIENDDLPPDKLEEFIRSALINVSSVCSDGAAIYVACPPGTPLPALIASFAGSGFEFRWGLIWLKDQIVLSRADYHFKHENILYGWKPGAAHYFTPDRKQASVFEYPRPKSSEEHPTMKPIELIQHMVRNSSEPGNIVIDVFGGSGSTMLACQNEGRISRLVELAPNYCAVILERMTTAFPELTIERISFTVD